MKNKIALVTGSSKGIGRELVVKLADNGYNVIINYLTNEFKAKELEKFIKEKYDVDVLSMRCDVTNENEIQNMFHEINKRFGKIDIVINNAAVCFDNYIIDKTKEEFMKVLETNLVGPFLISKYASKYMNGGIIVNISSKDATTTYNEISIDYCASKAGLNSLTQTLSLALPNIKILSVMPGWVKTESVEEMNQDYLNSELKRVGQKKLILPENIAKQIINIINDEKIKSGSIIELEDE